MSQPELLRTAVEALASAGVEYMLTGSLASSLQGEPRATHDIDVVIDLDLHSVDLLVEHFPEADFYLNKSSIVEAIKNDSMFNIVDIRDGGKIDFWMLTADAYDQSRFARRRHDEIDGLSIPVSSPEDTILAKLRWAQLSGGSEKQYGDALRVYEVQASDLDHEYVNDWAKRLQIESLWHQIQSEAETL